MKSLFLLSLLPARLLVSCQEPFDPVELPHANPNPLIDSTGSVLITGVVDPVEFVMMVTSQPGTSDYPVGDTFRLRQIGVEVFDSSPGDSLDAQAARAGITPDSALGMKALAFADSVLRNREVEIARDPLQPNQDAGGAFLRHIRVTTGFDSMKNTYISEDYAEALRKRGLARK